jgi:protein arginine kinase activator
MVVCERCKKAQATFHLTDIKPSGEKVERHLCEKCAGETGHLQKPNISINEILAGFIANKSLAAEVGDLECTDCGLTFIEFKNNGLLGCPQDYDVFREQLSTLLDRAHDGASHHIGKVPKSTGTPRVVEQDIIRIKRQLEEAVTAEDYERAAELRDRIDGLEKS